MNHIVGFKHTRTIRSNDAGELFKRSNNVPASIGLEVFNFNAMELAHCKTTDKKVLKVPSTFWRENK